MKQSFLLNQDHSKEVITRLSQNQYSICRQSLTITNCLFALNVLHLILRRCFYLLFSKWINALSVCLYKKSMGQRGSRSIYIAVCVIVEQHNCFLIACFSQPLNNTCHLVFQAPICMPEYKLLFVLLYILTIRGRLRPCGVLMACQIVERYV